MTNIIIQISLGLQ